MAESGREQIRVAPKPADESIVTRTAVDDVVGRVLNDDAIHAHPPTGVEIVIAIAAKQTICPQTAAQGVIADAAIQPIVALAGVDDIVAHTRSEEHTSELQ